MHVHCEPARESPGPDYPYTMRASFLHRRACLRFLLAALTPLAGTGCDSPPQDSPAQDVQQRLVGTWLREYAEGGTQVRRILVLQQDGHFREATRVTASGAVQAEYEHSGDWLFDGTNLKRRYSMMDGRLPAAPTVPFATFELRFPSRNEFIGVDRVHKREVAYQRVADGTLP